MAFPILTKFIIILIISIVILQIVHLILLYQLDSIKTQNYARLKDQNYLDLKQLDLDKYRIIKKIKNSHVLDSSGQYHIINNLLNNLNNYENMVDYYDQQQNPLDNQSDKPNDLTLLTQCSASRLYYIEDLLHAYQGPISLSIFSLATDIPNLLNVLMLLRKCLPLFREYVKVHLVYPLGFDSYNIKLPSIDLFNLSCSTLSHHLVSLRKHKDEFRLYGEVNNIQFPVNLLRNIARKNADTNYILVLDIDLIPSKSLRKDFIQFIKQNKDAIKLDDNTIVNMDDQIVFVLPVFEMDVNLVNNLHNIFEDDDQKPKDLIDDDKRYVMNDAIIDDISGANNQENEVENDELNVEFKTKSHLGINLGNIVGKNFGTYHIPTDKSSLLQLIKKKLVRPFYASLCLKCQKATNYEKWQIADHDDRLQILYEIFWQDPYEPFYIAMNSPKLPYYDQRFKQYGFNRISQVCNLHIVGYRFFAMSNHFLVHKGFKKNDKFHDDKDLELERNRLLFRQFKNELKQMYPNIQRRCY